MVKYSTNIQQRPHCNSNCTSQTSCGKMSDFVINLDLLGGLSLDEWLKETDKMEEESNRERRHVEINERDTEEREKSRNKARTVVVRRCGRFTIFRPGVPTKIWLLILNQSTKWS